MFHLNRFSLIKMMLFSTLFINLVSCNDINKINKDNEFKVFFSLDKYLYEVGEVISFNNLEVLDKVTRKEILDYKIYLNEILISNNEYVFKSSGTYSIYIKKDNYQTYKFDNDIEVIDNNVKSKVMTLDLNKTKTNYYIGDIYSYNDIYLYDEFNKRINNFNSDLNDGYIFNSVGEFKINLSYLDYTDISYVINVKESITPILKITNKPNKLYYELGDRFSKDGLKVINLNNNEEITDYSLSILDGEILNTLGKIEVIVSKNNFVSTSFYIEVNNKTNINDITTLDIYTINDTHGAFSRNGEVSPKQAGMSYISSYYNNLKDVNTLFLSSGDMFQGGIESNNTKGLIMTEAMNYMNIDAMTIGNHEFDWDEEYIIKNKELMEFPLLASNIFYKDSNEIPSYLDKSVIITRNDLDIGIIGSVRENLGSSIISSISSKFDFPNPISYIKEESDKLRKLGCDVIILLSHDEGYDINEENKPTKFYDLTKISNVSNSRYVDAMIFGHDHNLKYGIYNDVSYVEARCNGSYLGNIKINLKKVSDYNYEVINSNSSVLDIYNLTNNVDSDTNIDNLLFKYKDEIGDINGVIYNFNNYYSKNEFTYIVSQAIVWFINNNKEKFDNKEINIGVHNFAGIRSAVNKGEFKESDLVKVCPFSNSISIIKCNKSMLNYLINSNNAVYYLYDEALISNDGYYYIGTISYIAEFTDKNNNSRWLDYKEYNDFIIKDVVKDFLVNNKDLNL